MAYPHRGSGLPAAARDCLFLSLLVSLSLILYVRGLGFYSDDWAFLASLSGSDDGSIVGLFRALEPHMLASGVVRPVQMLYLAILYGLFGLDPLGYHLVNGAVQVATAVLFYAVLAELNRERLLAISLPLTYALLPHYSTDRFWPAAFQANLSMALYFLSLYSDLRTVRERNPRLRVWRMVGVLALLGSTLAYEIALPLFLINAPLVWYRARQRHGPTPGWRPVRATLLAVTGINLAALTVVVAYKASTTTRGVIGPDGGLVGPVLVAARLAREAIAVNYGAYGVGLPRTVWRALNESSDPPVLIAGGLLGLAAFSYLGRVGTQGRSPPLVMYAGCTVSGLVVVALGYATVLIRGGGDLTPTGIDNRLNTAAAVGVALSFVGIIGWCTDALVPSGRRQGVFCALVALLGASGFLINNTLASYWVAAYARQQEIVGEIRAEFASLPPGSTLLLDGVCPYVGPAVVFESSWDLAGALQLSYGGQGVRADVVTPDVAVGEHGLSKTLYGEEHYYPYGELWVYNAVRKSSHRLSSAEDARRYFQTGGPYGGRDCPPGREGFGVAVF